MFDHTTWVRRALQQSELMRAFKIPYATQISFPPDLCDRVCDSLQNLVPVGVLRLLLSLIVPLKGRRFIWGGCYPLEKLPSRKKVDESKMAKEGATKSPLAALAPARKKLAPAVPFEAPVACPPSKESPGRFVKPSVSTTSTTAPMVIPLGLSVYSTPAAYPMVILTSLPSEAPSFEEPQGKNQAVSKSSGTVGSQGVPTHAPSTSEAPMLNSFKAPFAPMVIPIRLPSEAPPSEEPVSKPTGTIESQCVSTQVRIVSEAPRLSPFTSPLALTNGPPAAKRERPGTPTGSDVGPEANKFSVATKADDADVPEHLFRALKVNRAPTSQEGKALTLLRGVLLRRWRKITTR
jgi:hypothetical protein